MPVSRAGQAAARAHPNPR